MNKSALPSLKFKIRRNYSGQSIIEIVLSVGVAALVIGALVVLGTVSLRTALSSARRSEATRLAVSGIEAMRFYRDTQGYEDIEEGCYEINSDGSITKMSPTGDSSCSNEGSGWVEIDLTNSASQSIFNRKIKVEAYGDAGEDFKMKKVTTNVRWAESGGSVIGGVDEQRNVVMTVVLSNWQQ